MEVAFGIAIGVGTVETVLLVGVAYALVTGELDNIWREHRRETTDRLNTAWQVKWQNGEGVKGQDQ